MGNLFNRLRTTMYKTVNTVYSSEAVWGAFVGQVLFNDPSTKEVVDGSEFMPVTPWMEFLLPLFAGLKLSVDTGIIETVVIDGVSYYVRSVDKTHDGFNCRANLEIAANPYGSVNQTL